MSFFTFIKSYDVLCCHVCVKFPYRTVYAACYFSLFTGSAVVLGCLILFF